MQQLMIVAHVSTAEHSTCCSAAAVNQAQRVCELAGGQSDTLDAAPLSQAPAFSPAQQELWAELASRRSEIGSNKTMGNVNVSYNADDWCQDAHGLFGLPKPQQKELAWHVLAQLRPHLHDMDGPVSNRDFEQVVVTRAAVHGDYSPLVWALGLQQPVAPGTSSPLPPPADPPLETIDLEFYLVRIVSAIKHERNIHLHFSSTPKLSIQGHLSAIQQAIAQLSEEQRQFLLGEHVSNTLTEDLWALYRCAASTQPFWQLVKEHPTLHPGVFDMVKYLPAEEVQQVAKRLLQLVPLTSCTTDDIWWLVARLDNAAGDRDLVLRVLASLAQQAPQHDALFVMGDLLLKYVENSSKPKVFHPAGRFSGPCSPVWIDPTAACVGFTDGTWQFASHLTCRMSSAEVVEWVTQLQLVLPPQQTCYLVADMLEVGASTLRKTHMLQLYGLMVQQLAKPGWEVQQQQQQQEEEDGLMKHKKLHPGVASQVLSLLPDASKSWAAATKVLVVWRHMAGALDPAWCEGGLAAAAKAAGQAVRKGTKQQQQQQQPAGNDSHPCPVPTGMHQHLNEEAKKQVDVALQRLGLLAELREVHMYDEPAEDGDEGALGFAGW
jgi:hypothetical protein